MLYPPMRHCTGLTPGDQIDLSDLKVKPEAYTFALPAEEE